MFRATVMTILPLLMLLGGPVGGISQEDTGQDRASHESSIREWHARRVASLTSGTSWLSLAGLFWLRNGDNTFGSGKGNDLVFPEGRCPERLGVFRLSEGMVSVSIAAGVDVRMDSVRVTEQQMRSDADGSPSILSYGSLSWFVIKRGDRYAIRLRDSENPGIREFTGIELYPIDAGWRVPARFEPYDPPRTIMVPNIIGTVDEEPCPGALVFEIGGVPYRLDPIAEAGARQLFLVFADETNGLDTYGGGRFLYIDPPGPDGMTVIDFNRSYNPPCAFTEFATCPLPPRQNRLPIPVTAGEKKYEGFDH